MPRKFRIGFQLLVANRWFSVGEIEYESSVSQRTEHLPIFVSVLGAPGADMQLLDAIIRTLEQADRNTTVSTGSKMGFTAKYVRRNPSS